MEKSPAQKLQASFQDKDSTICGGSEVRDELTRGSGVGGMRTTHWDKALHIADVYLEDVATEIPRLTKEVRDGRTAGMLLELLQWDFSGDLQTKLEAYERVCDQFSAAAGEPLGDYIRIGMVLNRTQDHELATHLSLNFDRLNTWPLLRAAIIDIAQARAATSGSYPGLQQQARGPGDMRIPMDVSGLDRQRGRGRGGGRGRGKGDSKGSN